MSAWHDWLFGKVEEEPPAQSQIGTTTRVSRPASVYWENVPHGMEGSGYFEDDGWEWPAWMVNVYRALRGLGWNHEQAYAGMMFATSLADEGIADEVTLLRRALRVGD